ncbi:carboxypeptidase-like regulatory domain-containing protein [Psychroflexus sp. CAK8W]|uniref:Carboxypeptidase-like regulatory domain-containing protein n=1 Tax=Psychroflexus longus TaxID=2873596 RepID=A0ABS7XGF9_9FLAO|nr:carboxypeptidase-like regulatory domain-containing protein [Psychroflexus longus]MBZ9777790.1 carboxypeptidase-like regulatory domain-containing protein [Psychroflexus longus]
MKIFRFILLLLCLFFTFLVQAQEFKIKGQILEKETNLPLEGSSIVVSTSSKSILGYTYSTENGRYELAVDSEADSLSIKVSSFGYESQEIMISNTKSTINQDFELTPKVEQLNTVVLETEEKIKVNRDTVAYRVSAFADETEQTVEDVLKNLPGIEIDEDGNIKAQGKDIQKILIEGDDLADRNYKVISKNLDADVLSKVEVINNYSENPVLKQFLDSETVVLNLKLKDKAKSIWLGAAKAGLGNDSRYEADLNLGLIRPEIKFLDLGNLNSIGKPAGEQLDNYVYQQMGFNDFDENFSLDQDSFLNLRPSSILIDDKFYIENQSLSNNLLANKSIWGDSKLRNSLFVNTDQLNSDYRNRISYFLPDGDIDFQEDNAFNTRNLNLKNDFEIKHSIDEDHFITFQTDISGTNSDVNHELLFNAYESIAQVLDERNLSLSTNVHLTKKIKNGALSFYGFTGYNEDRQTFDISPNTISEEQNSSQLQTEIKDNTVYQGLKGSSIFQFNELSFAVKLGVLNQDREFNYGALDLENDFGTSEIDSLSGSNSEARFKSFVNFKTKYDFIPDRLIAEADVELSHVNMRTHVDSRSFLFFNPNVALRLRKTKVGSFSLRYKRINELPSLTDLNQNFIVQDYRSLVLGVNRLEQMTRNQYSFNYIFSRPKKRILIEAGVSYSDYEQQLSADNLLSERLNLSQRQFIPDGSLLTARLGFTTFLKLIDATLKLGYTKTSFENPFILNDELFEVTNEGDNYYFRGTTYWDGMLNFKFSGSVNSNSGGIGNSSNTNNIYNAKLETVLKLYDRLFGNFKNEIYDVNSEVYQTSSFNLEYRPKQKSYVFGIDAQNIFNTKNYTFSSITNFQRGDLVYRAVPRFFVGYMKFRF